MQRILLVCSQGMSTSILVQKMQNEAKEQGIEVLIEAHANASLENQKGNWDVCLLGPQIRYAKKQVQAALDDIPTDIINMQAYGMGDGKAVLKQAFELMQ